jgi:hypothetical protein
MAFGPYSNDLRERRAFAHAKVAIAVETGLEEDVAAAHNAIRAAGNSRKTRNSGFEDRLKGVARAVGVDIRRYLLTSQELLDPSVRAVQVGELTGGAYGEVYAEMQKQAERRGIVNPCMIANLIFRKGVESYFGSTGKPYPLREDEWDVFAASAPEYCGDNVPLVYLVDGDKYLATI